MSRIRLALVRQRYNAFGGAERFVDNAIRALARHDVGITLITRDWQSSGDFQTEICNPFFIGRWWRDASFAHAVKRYLSQQRFDLIQSHERIAACDLFRAGDGVHREWLTQKRRTLNGWGSVFQSLNPYHRYTLAAEKKLFSHAQLKAVICNSRMVRDELIKHFDVADNKLHIIYSGVDLTIFHPGLSAHGGPIRRKYGIPEDSPVFIFVGSGFGRKGLRAALCALKEQSPHVHLMVVGKDRALSQFQKLSHEFGLANRVHFTGPQADVTPYYGAADALILPTLYDPFPNVVLEALASGLPVITSVKSGAAEIIQTGINGYVCDALDIPALSAHMRQCALRADTMRDAARASVAAFTPEAMSRQLIDLYEALLAPQKP